MAEDDVKVKFSADDSELRRAIDAIKADFSKLDSQLVATGERIAAGLRKMGLDPAKVFPKLDPQSQQALAHYGASLEQVKNSTTQLSEASEQAGSAFERMVGRILTRLVVFKLLFEAIRLIKEALQESIAYQAAQVRFENLSTAVEGSAKAWEHLRQVAHETGISTEQLSQAQMSLEKMGVSGREVGGVMENLAKYSKITGENVGTLAQEWGRLERKEGSVQDMRDLAYATHDINLERLVNNLAETQRLAPIVAQQQVQINQHINRAADDTDRLRNAQIGVAQALHLSGEAYKEFIGIAGRQGGVAGQATGRLRGELAVGATQLAAEGEPTVQQMRSMGISGKEIYQILMQAAERYHERVRELMRRQQEDARENVRLKAARDLLGAEDKVAQAIEAGIGANTAFGKAMETAEGLSDLIKEHMKEIVDDATAVSTGIQTWNKLILDFIDHLQEAGKWIENTPLAKVSGWLGEQSFKNQYEKEHGPGSYDALIHPSKPQWGLVPGNLSMSGLTPQQFMAGSGATPRDIADKLAQKQDEANQHHASTKEILRGMYNTLQMAFGA